MVVEFEYLQDVQAYDQDARNGGDEHSAGHQSFVDQARLLFVVFDRYRSGHLCSSSLTLERAPVLRLEISPLKNELHHTKNRAVTLVRFAPRAVLEGPFAVPLVPFTQD